MKFLDLCNKAYNDAWLDAGNGMRNNKSWRNVWDGIRGKMLIEIKYSVRGLIQNELHDRKDGEEGE